MLKDYSTYLEHIEEKELSNTYLESYTRMKAKWELAHRSTVEHPTYKATRSNTCEDINSVDYGYQVN